ncbi:hypothetical protein VSDG_03777 [Cytospora chrysosperma]|uniref:CENP-V/GFA domain-containing protein n=1 Tax=Cytospora chrysosperma TaxID=252740 RepID=A0A423W6S3_CYTCH|nr:hypothetical protein VSDG_03777 [Valsa sordida]
MSLSRPLRGSCACHRNQYFIRAPEGANDVAQVLFGTDPSHRTAQASLLAAHVRVPLTWYHSATFAFFPDETASSIRRLYENPFEGHARRHFCGFCGTPLTYWHERPRSEADYIQVTVGSLCREDLGDLEDMGLIPDSPTSEGETFELPARGGREPAQATGQGDQIPVTTSTSLQPMGRETQSIPWIDSIVEGSRLGGRLKGAKGTHQSADGTTRIDWEIVEYHGEGVDDEDAGSSSSNNGKRKLGDRDDVDDGQMEGVSQQ